ncbi:MAG: NAD(P)H-dependent oxidoreductase [Candidatus Anstonellaceae archaeon]
MLKVIVIYSYPQNAPHGQKILSVLEQALQKQNVEYKVIDLYSENFNPVLHDEEYSKYGQHISYDIAKIQQELKTSDIYIFLYPVWWSSPPAILKGFVDRVFLPNFAFRFENKKLVGLLKDKVALVICTYGGSAVHEQKVGFASKKLIQKAILESCGIKTQVFEIYSVDEMDKTVFDHILFQIPSALSRIIAFYKNLDLKQQPLGALIEENKQKEKEMKATKKLPKKSFEDLRYFESEQKKAKQKARKSKRF